METLTKTAFFGLLSKPGILQTEELELSVSYKKFIRLMIGICFEKKEDITSYFVLNYTLIELGQVEELISIHEKKSAITIIYLHKAIKAVECALDWLLCHENQPNSVILLENEPPDFYFYWTGTAINLLEMALSSHATGSINNGNISLKEVVSQYFKMFGMKIPNNFSSTYGIMRLRPESRTLVFRPNEAGAGIENG